MTPAALVASIERHFAAGCGFIDASQYRAHKETGACPACKAMQQRAAVLAQWHKPQLVTLVPRQPDRFGG